VTTDGPSGNGSRSIPSTIRMPASVAGTSPPVSQTHERRRERYR